MILDNTNNDNKYILVLNYDIKVFKFVGIHMPFPQYYYYVFDHLIF